MRNGWKTILLLALPLLFSRCLVALDDLTILDPPTVYIQWLTSSSSTITVDDGDESYAFDPYLGGGVTQLSTPSNKEMYIGVMCNQLSGYEISLTADSVGATANTGKLVIAGGTPMTYSASLATEASTFSGGANTTATLDLTGASVSATATFTTPLDLPLQANNPNVWRLTLSLPTISSVGDGLVLAGTYSESLVATIALK